MEEETAKREAIYVNETIKEDFDSEWHNHNYHFPYIDVINANDNFKQAFFDEFSKLTPKPKFAAYMRNFIPDEDWTAEALYGSDKMKAAKISAYADRLLGEYNNLVGKNKLPDFGYGRSLKDTKTATILAVINAEINNFQDYIFTNTDEHQYNQYAKITAEKVVNEVNKLSIAGLAKDIIDSLFLNAHTVSWDVKFYLKKLDAIQRQDTQRRYADLEKYFYSAIKQLLPTAFKISISPSNDLHMNQTEYVDLILNGYSNHADFLPHYFYREYKKALEKHIGFSEFFKRLLDANKIFIQEIDLKRFEEANKWGLAKAQMEEKGTWTEELEQASKLNDREFSVNLFSLTNGRFKGHLFTSDLASINNAISKAIEMIEVEINSTPTVQKSDNGIEISLAKLENKFDSVPIIDVYNHFKKGLVDKHHLSEQNLLQFLSLAFHKTSLPTEKFKLKSVNSKQKIINVFGEYFRSIAGKPHGKKSKYVELLCNYFEGYKTENVASNFSR